MTHRTDHLFSKGKMVIKLKHTKRFGLSLLFVYLLAGCAVTPPRHPTIEHVDRDEIKAALKRNINPALPGPPPFTQKILPKAVALELPETLYSMTLNNVPLSAAIEAVMQGSHLNLSVESSVDLSRRVTVHLKQATFAEAMDMLVKNGAG